MVVGVEDGGVVLILWVWIMSSFLHIVQVVGVEDGGVVGIEEGGVNVAVEEGAVQVNHMKVFKFVWLFSSIFFPKVDFGDATLTIVSVGFGLLLILLLVTGV